MCLRGSFLILIHKGLFEGFNPLYPTNAIKVFVIRIDFIDFITFEHKGIKGIKVELQTGSEIITTESDGLFDYKNASMISHVLFFRDAADNEIANYVLDFTKGNETGFVIEGSHICITYENSTEEIFIPFVMNTLGSPPIPNAAGITVSSSSDCPCLLLIIIIIIESLVILTISILFFKKDKKRKES